MRSIPLQAALAHPREFAAVVGARQFWIQNRGTNQCMDAANDGDYNKPGDPIQLFSCLPNDRQTWSEFGNSEGQLKIQNADGLCLDADSQHFPHNGDVLQLWNCNPTTEQDWGNAGNSFVAGGGSTNACIDAESSNYPNDRDKLQLWGCNNHPEQHWEITPIK